jgi:hypothetical protein
MARELFVLRISKRTFGQVNDLKLGFESAENATAFTYVTYLPLFVVYMCNPMTSYGFTPFL